MLSRDRALYCLYAGYSNRSALRCRCPGSLCLGLHLCLLQK